MPIRTEIAVVGSLNLDTTVRVARLPAPGETVLGTGHDTDTGGKGANQAVAAARLGRSVAMLGAVGRDDAGERLLAALLGDGVDTMTVARLADVPTGIAVITVDEAAENTIVVDPGANAAFSPAMLQPHHDLLAATPVVMLQLEIPLETVAAAAASAGGLVVLNPAPAIGVPADLMAQVDVVVPNETELGLLAGVPTPAGIDEAVAAAQRLQGPAAVVVTLGSQGALVVDGAAVVHVPTPRVAAVDPTAAGDAFCGGLADALVRGLDLVAAVRWAVLCGAVTVTRRGAQSSLPTRSDVETLEAAS